MAPPFIRRVQIENFRSIASCDVALGPLMFIVGRNGSGKSNFLDALRLVSEILRDGLWNALDDRGGISDATRIQAPSDITIRLEIALSHDVPAEYSITIRPKHSIVPNGAHNKLRLSAIVAESCRVGNHWFKIGNGALESSFGWPAHSISPDRPFAAIMSGLPELRPLTEFLANIAIYNFEPERMRPPYKIDGRLGLERNGRNLSAVIGNLQIDDPSRLKRIVEYLAVILPSFSSVERLAIGEFETLQFRQGGASLGTTQVSEGTLRALAVLTAALGSTSATAIGIEDPETALHPGAVAVIRDALDEGSASHQILVASQSPELLDDTSLKPEQILAVDWIDGQTKIGPVTAPDAEMLRSRLLSAGELLHQSRLEPA